MQGVVASCPGGDIVLDGSRSLDEDEISELALRCEILRDAT